MKTTHKFFNNRYTTYKWLFTLLFISFGFISWGQWTEDFNSEHSSSYGTGTITISGRDWTRKDAGNFAYANTTMGSYAFTINDDKAGAHITTPPLNTCGTISFLYAYKNGSSSNEFELQVSTDGSNFSTIDTHVLGASSNQNYVAYSYDVNNSSSTTYVRILSDNQNAHLFIEDFSYGTFASSPTITTTPTSLTGFTYVEGNGPSAEQSFTVEGSDLTNDITVTPPANWEISTTSGGPYQTTAITLTQSGGTVNSTTIYTRMVSGLLQANSPFSGNIVCTSTGATDTNVAVDGTVTFSASSDIVENATFVYTSNIDYTSFQGNPITNTSNSVGVFKFDIRDGGGSADADALGTELTDITFDVLKIANIRNASLFDGNTKLADGTVGVNTISFSGLSGADYTAPDDGTKSLTLRVSFKTTVTDNDQMRFTISSATANSSGSVFATSDAGGAASSITGDRNRIEVTATDLLFNQQPTNTNTNQTMSPAVTVDAVDDNLNIDLDFTGTVDITSTGTLSTAQSESAVSGTATFSNIVHTVAGTGLTLTATSAGLTQDVSNTFDIEDFVNNAGDFRPKHVTTFASNGDWEYYDGSAWGNVPDGKAPQNTTTTVSRILIDKNVNAAGSASHNYNCDIIVFSGGTLEITDDDTPPVASEFLSANNTLEIKNGGVIKIQGDIDLAATTNFILRDGSKMYIDQASMNNEHPMWDGVELFEGGSEVEINNWDWTASSIKRSLINVDTAIADNANGYKFGKVYFNPTTAIPSGKNWTIVGGPISVNVAENDFQINNAYSDYVSVMSNKTAGISATFGGDLVVDDGLFAFGSSYSSDAFDQTIVIKGDVLIGSDDDVYLHKAFNGTPTVTAGDGQIKVEGNIEVWQMGTNVLSSDVETKQILLTGDNSHTLYIDRNCSNMPLIVEGGDSAELVDSDLKFEGNSSIEIEDGATFNFGFNGATALEVQNISGGGNKFLQRGGAYLFITHPQGIWDASANGNVQGFAASNTTYTQANSTYHYIGKTNQETGDIFTSGSTSKTIICDLENSADELTVTATTGTSALLDIRSGIVVNTDANHIFGSGALTIAANGGLKTSVLSATSNVPMLTGTFTINGGFIELNAAGDQVLKGSHDYKDLIFSNSGTKTITSAIPNIDGTITVKNAAILDVENHQMGGAGTDLTMTDTAQYITDGTSGTGVKPDAQGTYSLGVGTKVIFEGSGLTLQRIRLFRDYYNIDVVGANVGTEALSTPIRFQSGGTFTVKNNAVFKLKNTSGFNGGTTTAIDNTNNPTIILEPGSGIEYYGDAQVITPFQYQNLIIFGTGTKTLGHASGVVVNEELTLDSKILIGANQTLTVVESIANTGEMEILHEGSLLQTHSGNDSNAEDGTYKVHKTTRPYVEYDYTHWSSPVQNESIGDVFTANSSVSRNSPNNGNSTAMHPYSPSNRIYWHNTANYDDTSNDGFDDDGNNWVHYGQDDIMLPARGLIAQGAGSDHPFNPWDMADGLVQSVYFESTRVNNGDITLHVDLATNNGTSHDFKNKNLVGNPYPSAINLQLLKNDPDNAGIVGETAYFWSHDTTISAGGNPLWDYNFTDDDYATLNITNGTGTQAHAGSLMPTIYLASCSSVMLEIAQAGDLHFKNSMRVAGNNDHFFSPNAETPVDKLWVNLSSEQGEFEQIAVVFMEGADDTINDYDSSRLYRYDEMDFYSLAPDREIRLAIQGVAPFVVDKVIPLGVNLIYPGAYSIALDRFEGIFNTQNVYLKDNFTHSLHNLSESKYDFSVMGAETGVNNRRFELVFVDETSLNDPEAVLESLSVYPNPSGGVFHLLYDGNAPVHTEVFDLTGKQVQSSDSNTIDLSRLSKGVYLAHIRLNGNQIVKKLVLR